MQSVPEAQSAVGQQDLRGLPIIVLGVARLPAGALGEKPSPLMIELALDESGNRVLEVATNIPLPGYNRMLRRLLVETYVSEVDAIARRICAHYRGPLVKPTVAALRSAVAQALESTAS